MKHLYYNSENHLCLENIDLAQFTDQHSTPFYMYGTGEIKNNCQEILSLGGSLDFLPCYALKANYNPTIINIIKNMGFGADVVSGGELYFALRAGIPSDKIVFAGVGKTEDELALAIENEIHSIVVESESELKIISKIAKQKNKTINIAFRVNPDIDAQTHPFISTGLHSNKFGIDKETALKLYKKTDNSIFTNAVGVHVHIGSQIESAAPYQETAKFLANFLKELYKIGIEILYIDLGGGIGINYQNQISDKSEERTHLRKILPELFKPFIGMKKKIVMELGRSVVGTAGILITKIIYIKKTAHKKFVIVDAAMNNLIRPSLYDAYHQIVPIKDNHSKTERVDVVGPVCESSDFFAKDRILPKFEEGDYLAITGAGAYAQALASNYNLRPLITEYLVETNRVETIFKGESALSIAEKYDF
jgi:diaminopimelate decarboxylase